MPVDLSGLTTKAPPRKREPRATTTPKASGTAKQAQRTEAVNGIFQLAQAACAMTGNHKDAAAIGMHAENISAEIVKLADINEAIAKSIDFLLTAGPYAGLVTACLPLAMQIMANHNRLPESTPGIIPPDILELRFKVGLEQQKAALEREYAELSKMAQEYELQDQASQNGNGPQEAAQGQTGPYL